MAARATATLRPLIVRANILPPTISMTNNITVSPLAVAATIKTPGTPAIVTSLPVTVTIVTPTVV